MNKTTKLLIPLFFGVSFAYFIWLVWEKLTTMIGDSDKVLLIMFVIVVIGIWLGKLSINKLTGEFTK